MPNVFKFPQFLLLLLQYATKGALRLSFLFKKVGVCGHCLVTLSLTSCSKMALIAAHLNAGIILVVTV